MGRATRIGLVLTISSMSACGLSVFGSPSEDEETPNNGAAPDPSKPGANDDGAAQSPNVTEDGSAVTTNDGAAPDGKTPTDGARLPDVLTPPPGAGKALQFTNGNLVSVGAALAIPSDFTLEAWIRPTSFGAERYIVAKDRSGQGAGQLRLGLSATGNVLFIMSDAGGDTHGVYTTGYNVLSPSPVVLNTWSHVAITKGGAVFTLYINGTAVSTLSATAAFSYGGPAVDFRIAARVGANGSDTNGGFEGAIDEVRLWNVARTGPQIVASRSMVILPTNGAYANLTAYYRLDEGAGTTTANAKAGPNGTLVASPMWINSTIF